MKKLLAALLLLLGAFGLASIDWRPLRPREAAVAGKAAKGSGSLQAGAARVDLTPPGRVPVAGFPRWAWDDKGVRDPVSARALVLAEPGCAVALVSAELLLVPAELQRAVEDRLRDLHLDLVVVAATHTHAGPGGFWDNPLGERIATGPFDRGVFHFLADRLASAVRLAWEAKRPATLAFARAELPDFARNRDGGAVDGRLDELLVAGADGKPVARAVIFPAHATILSGENRELSGDWPGVLSRGLEKEQGGAPALFFQGAVGDQSAKLPGGGPIPAPRDFGEPFLAEVRKLAFPPGDAAPPLSLAEATVLLPAPEATGSPPIARRIAANLLVHWMPERARVAALRAGKGLFLFVPGEPTALVAKAWRAAHPDAILVAVALDYVGYVETAEGVRARSGEAGRTYYGPELAARLGDALDAAAAATR